MAAALLVSRRLVVGTHNLVSFLSHVNKNIIHSFIMEYWLLDCPALSHLAFSKIAQ